ncbi:MAG: ParB N-terminal domain-containing protein [Lachnospiraceae bacterium]|nr:ParB N-terminal domain-containing protein [Lachnospiraceae bacterium]
MKQYQTKAKPKATADGIPVFCSHDEIVATAKLVPNPKNPNHHPDDQIRLLGNIIRSNGWRAPITVSTRSGFVVKGHGRLLAAEREELKEVPVDYQEYANEAEEYADLMADNRIAELAEMDQMKLAEIFSEVDLSEIPTELTGYTDEEKDELTKALLEGLNEEDVSDEDSVPDATDDTVTKRGDLWMMRGHRLVCGDATDEEDMKKLLGGGTSKVDFDGSAVQCVVCGKVKGQARNP